MDAKTSDPFFRDGEPQIPQSLPSKDAEFLFLVGGHAAFPERAGDLDSLADQFDRLLDQRQRLELRLLLRRAQRCSHALQAFTHRPSVRRRVLRERVRRKSPFDDV